jgi:hypothetical protein
MENPEEVFNNYIQSQWLGTIYTLAKDAQDKTGMNAEELLPWGVWALQKTIANYKPRKDDPNNEKFIAHAMKNIVGEFAQENIRQKEIPQYVYHKFIKPIIKDRAKTNASEVREIPVEEHQQQQQQNQLHNLNQCSQLSQLSQHNHQLSQHNHQLNLLRMYHLMMLMLNSQQLKSFNYYLQG